LENVWVTRSYNSGPNLQARSRPLFFLRSQANYFSSKADKKSVPFTKAIEEEQYVDIPFDDQDDPLGRKTTSRKGKEGSLEAVKAAGMQYLEDTAKELATKARQSLLISEEDDMPSVNQLREANLIQEVTEDVLEKFCKRNDLFCLGGDPIMILDAEVSPDLRHARVFWSLPYVILLNARRFPPHIQEELVKRMEERLFKHGGKLQVLVHARLRSYYPPNLRFVAANEAMVQDLLL
jgi:ribosome-binding factor A